MSRQISPSELLQHSSEKDCWIVVNGKVYDVTRYLNDHPGGVDIITELAGKDATEDYNDVGHTSDADNVLATLQIGVLNASAASAPAASASAPAAKPMEQPRPVAAAAPAPVPAQRQQPAAASKPPKQQAPESDNTLLIVGGAVVAIATAAFFLLKKSKD